MGKLTQLQLSPPLLLGKKVPPVPPLLPDIRSQAQHSAPELGHSHGTQTSAVSRNKGVLICLGSEALLWKQGNCSHSAKKAQLHLSNGDYTGAVRISYPSSARAVQFHLHT